MNPAGPETRRHVEAIITRYIRETFIPRSPEVTLADDVSLIRQGVIIDSLGIVQLAAFLEAQFGITVQLGELLLDPHQTIAALGALVCSAVPDGRPAAASSKARDTKTPRGRSDPSGWFPLSDIQNVLGLPRTEAASLANQAVLPLRICSPGDGPALRRAVQALMSRHIALRSNFSWRGGELFQQIHHDVEADFEKIDAADWTWDELKQCVSQGAHRRFDLEREPPLRVRLYTRTPDDAVLLLVLHHVVLDGWSTWIVLDELRTLYAAARTGVTAPLPQILTSPLDYYRWRMEILAGPEGERLWRYWQQQFADPPAPLNLPTDYPRPPLRTDHGTSYAFRIAHGLTRQVESLARAEGATLYATLLSTFSVLLHHHTHQTDIIVGTVTANRLRGDFQGVVGDFADDIAFRLVFSGDMSWRTLLHRVRAHVATTLGHQGFPYRQLFARLHRPFDPSRPPLWQVSFRLHRSHLSPELVELYDPEPSRRFDFGGMTVESCRFLPLWSVSFNDLFVDVFKGLEALFVHITYNSDLFTEATIARLAAEFQVLLSRVVANPDMPIAQLPG